MTRNRILLGLGLLVSAFFLFLAFRGLHPEAFFASIADVNMGLLLLSAGLYFGAVTLISWRWQFFLRPFSLVKLADLVRLVAIGYMGNNVYPFRAGEALRIYLLKRNHAIPISKATVSVIVERVFDGIVMLSFIIVALLLLDEVQAPEIRTVMSIAAPIFFMALVIFFGFAFAHQSARRLAKRILARLPLALEQRLGKLVNELLDGLATLRSPLDLAGAIIASYASWAVEALVYWWVMQAFGIQVGYPVALLTVGTVNLAGLLPTSPGQIGVYEFFVSLVMVAAAGINQDRALAFAIVVHLVIWLPVTLVGFVLLARQGLGWSDITHAQELEAQAR